MNSTIFNFFFTLIVSFIFSCQCSLKKKTKHWNCSALYSSSCKDQFCAQLCPTFCDPMDCSPPGSFVCGVLQVRILEWLPFPSPVDVHNPGIKPMSLVSSPLAGGFFTTVPSSCKTLPNVFQKIISSLPMERRCLNS